MGTVLEARQVSKEVSSPEGSLTILSEVSFGIDAGETVAVVGPSGAGKSTLLALSAGLDLPTRGHVQLNGANLSELDEDSLRTATIPRDGPFRVLRLVVEAAANP